MAKKQQFTRHEIKQLQKLDQNTKGNFWGLCVKAFKDKFGAHPVQIKNLNQCLIDDHHNPKGFVRKEFEESTAKAIKSRITVEDIEDYMRRFRSCEGRLSSRCC